MVSITPSIKAMSHPKRTTMDVKLKSNICWEKCWTLLKIRWSAGEQEQSRAKLTLLFSSLISTEKTHLWSFERTKFGSYRRKWDFTAETKCKILWSNVMVAFYRVSSRIEANCFSLLFPQLRIEIQVLLNVKDCWKLFFDLLHCKPLNVINFGPHISVITLTGW